MGSKIERLENTSEVEIQPPFEDGLPEVLLEKLDEESDCDESELWLGADEFVALPLPFELKTPDEGADTQQKCDGFDTTIRCERWHTLTQRKCWSAGYPGEDGFKYL